MKAVGAVMILAAALLWGATGALRLKRRVKCLNALIAAIRLMENEMCTRLTPLPAICRLAADASPRPARDFLEAVFARTPELGERPFAEIWDEAACRTLGSWLAETDLALLAELGAGLGRYGVDEQSALLKSVGLRLEGALDDARADRDKNARVYLAGGASAGIFVVLALT